MGKVVAGPDYGSGDSDPRDTHGHGTHVAGIAAASRDNGTGSAGVCPACTLVAVKVFPDGASSASSFAVAQGITWAADNGVEVINLSLGSATPSSLTQSAVDYAWSRGAVVVAAAGNSSTSAAHYPAAFTNAIAVGATTASDTLASFSNYGSWVDMTAPGAGVLSTVPGSGYQAWSGTSMASPVVAGAAGLAFSGLPGATNATVRGALEAAVVDLGAPGRDTVYGTGRLDLSRLFGTPPGPNPNPPPPTAPPPSVTTTNLPTGTVGTAYATTLAASGGTTPLTWSLSSGALPAGLSLASTTGAISGTPSAAGGFSFTVRVADAGGRTATRVLYLSITAPPPPSILTSTLPAGVVGTTYTATLTAAGGKAPYTWSLAYGTLPAGLTLHPTTGAIGGTPTTAGTASLTVRVTDANNRTALRSYYLSVAPRPA